MADMTGRLIAVVGPSGVGKDSLIAGMIAADPTLCRIRRVITRPAGLGGEDFQAVTQARFEAMRQAGAFCLTWTAHGLSYGIPDATRQQVQGGASCLCNLSRGVLNQTAEVFSAVTILSVVASPAILAARLRTRGREDARGIAARLARSVPLPEHLEVGIIRNDGPLSDSVAQALAALYPERSKR